MTNILYISYPISDNIIISSERNSNIFRILTQRYTLFQLNSKSIKSIFKNELINMFILFFYGIKIIRYNKIDLIFCEHNRFAFLGVILGKFFKIPCIWDSHGNIKVFNKELNKPPIVGLINYILEIFLIKLVDKIITVSEFDKNLYISMGSKTNKIFVVPVFGACPGYLNSSLASRKKLLRAKLGMDSNKKILMFSGRLSYRPNKIALQYIEKVLIYKINKYRDDCIIYIIGGSDLPRQSNDSIIYTGFVYNIFEYILASDIFIVPQIIGPGVWTKIIDAMSCGVPIVTTEKATCGIPELRNEYNVIINRTLDGFDDKILNLLNNPTKMEELGKNAMRTIELYYNEKLISDKLFKIIESTI